MKITNEERGRPVVKGDLADLCAGHEQRLKSLERDLNWILMIQGVILVLLILFIFFPEIWASIKSMIDLVVSMGRLL
ncbi:MAG: hypothetical protein DSY80_07160 [Desulfocapsa sp.]|nr:MAG: hypothetical protein DSY80_07160 [Desulfocapsa sp.]